MEIIVYILVCLCISLDVYVLYKIYKLDKKVENKTDGNNRQLAEAGNALTDTLKVAFDSLKKNSIEHTKINSKISDHNLRIHRLEQFQNRKVKDSPRHDVFYADDSDALTKNNKKE